MVSAGSIDDFKERLQKFSDARKGCLKDHM